MKQLSRKYHDTFFASSYYHIYNRANGRDLLFKSEDNYHFFLKRIQKYILPYCDILSYCLLPNHFHFFIKIDEVEAEDVNTFIEKQFKNLFSSYALAFNKMNQRKGNLFQKGFKRISVANEKYFTFLIYYIHHNPIHHKLVTDLKNWKFSSYKAIISDQETSINKDIVLKWFGGKSQFIDFHNQYRDSIKINRYLF